MNNEMTGYPLKQLTYNANLAAGSLLHNLTGALRGTRITAAELEVVDRDIEAVLKVKQTEFASIQRVAFIRIAISFGIALVGIIIVFLGLTSLFQEQVPLVRAAIALFLGYLLHRGTLSIFDSHHWFQVPLIAPVIPLADGIALEQVSLPDQVAELRRALTLIRNGIETRRQWEQRGPPPGYGKDPVVGPVNKKCAGCGTELTWQPIDMVFLLSSSGSAEASDSAYRCRFCTRASTRSLDQ